MLDWLTLSVEIPPAYWKAAADYCSKGWTVQKFNGLTGEVAWSASARESIRSDTHQVTIRVTGTSVTVSGSPARSMGLDSNVFGTNDLREAALAHVRLARRSVPFPLPCARCWVIKRLDVTENYDLLGQNEVRQALAYMRQFDGGRYKADTRRAETIYWSPGSSMRTGKAYAKGPHLEYMRRKGKARATEEEVRLSHRLLRLELTLGREWWRRYRLNYSQWGIDIESEYLGYWKDLIGQVEVAEMTELEMFKMVAPTEGQALAAYRTWAVVKAVGHVIAREGMPRATWYRHKKIMFDAGLGWGDLASGSVVPFRRRTIVLESPVETWDDLRAA